jgi:hypothetical protein
MVLDTMEHTLLLREGKWSAKGSYIDGNTTVMPFQGGLVTTHGNKMWTHATKMQLTTGDTLLEVETSCDIIPFVKNNDTTTWNSDNPGIGILSGKFVIVDDAILSICHSETGEFEGSEYFLKVSDSHYRNWGILTRKRAKLSSWIMELTRVG